MRKIAVLLAVLLAGLVLPMPAFAMPAYKVTLRVIDHEGNPLDSATVEVFHSGGGKVTSGTTNATGYFVFEVLSNGTYVVVISKSYYIVDKFEVAGADVTKTINLTTGYYKLNASSTPITTNFNLTLTAVPGVVYTDMTTNVTIFLPAGEGVKVTFPKEITKYYVWKYTLDKLKYDYTETTENAVSLTMNANREVTAYYTKTFAITLEYWVVAILVVIILLALFVAWRAGARAAREAIAEYRERTRRFVRRK